MFLSNICEYIPALIFLSDSVIDRSSGQNTFLFVCYLLFCFFNGVKLVLTPGEGIETKSGSNNFINARLDFASYFFFSNSGLLISVIIFKLDFFFLFKTYDKAVRQFNIGWPGTKLISSYSSNNLQVGFQLLYEGTQPYGSKILLF